MTQETVDRDAFPDWPVAGAQPPGGMYAARRPVQDAPPVAGPSTQELQATAEGVAADDGTIEFLGERFRLAATIGLMPLMRFAHSAKTGMDSDDMEGMAALYEMIRDCIDTTADDDGRSEWDRFEAHATASKAEAEDFMEFISSAIEKISARPRQRRGNSSATSPATSEKSRAASSSPGKVPPGAEGLVSVADVVRSTG